MFLFCSWFTLPTPTTCVYVVWGGMGEACGWYVCVREVGVMFEMHSGIHEAHIGHVRGMWVLGYLQSFCLLLTTSYERRLLLPSSVPEGI